MALNRYDHDRVKHSIDGYMIPGSPRETREQEFDRAKANLLAQLADYIEKVRGFTFCDMTKKVS
jgi:hypothetical protein